jgi:serine/threonine protein kinase
MSLQKGVTVQGMRGRYRIDSLIGTGGLGRVWKATAANGSVVAIKEALTDGPQDQVRVNCEKLRVEAVVLERLTGDRPSLMSQPTQCYDLDRQARVHIVQFLDVDRINMPAALIIDFIAGRSIDDEFRSATPSDYGHIDAYIVTILNVLKSLHQNNILHRDISPHNLITTPDQDRDPILVDFGTVKEGYNQLSVSGAQWSQIVKPGYSAPELSLGLASPSSDLYSFAATLLFMYTGVNPQYLRNSSGDLDEVRKPQLRKVPEERLEVLKKALSFHPADRYQTADDMLNALAGRLQPLLVPHIVAAGRKFPIKKSMVLGKFHQCKDDCRRKGFSGVPDVAINDPESYISRHHARIRIGANGECYIEDLHATSGTGLRHASATMFERLQPGREYKLQDGDVIALAYSLTKGPYMTASYHAQ